MGQRLSHFEAECLAAAAHEVNRQYCRQMADNTHKTWDDTDNESKMVAINAVIGIATFDYNAEASHNAWVVSKQALGWNYSKEKNVEKKEHNCLVEYKDLPEEQRVKDELWISTVRNMLRAFWKIPNQ